MLFCIHDIWSSSSSSGYDRGHLPSSSCWYSPLTSVTWLIEPEIEVYIPTSPSTEPDFDAIEMALFINYTWSFVMCIFQPNSHKSFRPQHLKLEWRSHKDVLFNRIRATSTAVILISRGSISWSRWRTLLQPQTCIRITCYMHTCRKALELLKRRQANLACTDLQSCRRETWEVEITLQGGSSFRPYSFEGTHSSWNTLCDLWVILLILLIMIIDNGEHPYIILAILYENWSD